MKCHVIEIAMYRGIGDIVTLRGIYRHIESDNYSMNLFRQ